MIRAGIIGFGYAAQTFHAPFLQTLPHFELTAVCSSKGQQHQSAFPTTHFYSTPEELIKASNIDLVIITTPNDSHFPLAEACLLAGKHVVIEKPATTKPSHAEALIELADKQQKIVTVFHNRRWDGDFLTLKKLIAEDVVGDTRYFESHFDRFRPVPRVRWREQPGVGSGIWFDLGPHLIDQSLVLFGKPEAITARLRQLRENAQACDYFHALLHYPDKEVVLHASPFVASPNSRFVLAGSKGTYVKYGLDPQEEQLKSGLLPTDKRFAVEPEQACGHIHTESDSTPVPTLPGNYEAFFITLAQAIENCETGPVTLKDALLGLEIIEAGLVSSDLSKTIQLNDK